MPEPLETDYLVIGSGIAGLNFALLAAEHGRVVVLPPGGRWQCKWSLEVHDTAAGVAAVQAEIAKLQAHAPAVIHRTPQERFSPT